MVYPSSHVYVHSASTQSDEGDGEADAPFPNLSGVPEHLRDKILQFHKTLNAPDEFPITPPPTTARPKYGVAGLQEMAAGEVQARTPAPPLTLQNDLIRFSDRLSSPSVAVSTRQMSTVSGSQNPSRTTIYSSIISTRSRRKKRLESEWKKFLKWRNRRRRKKRMRKRVMKMLKRRIENKFGQLSKNRWRTLKRNENFRRKRKDINKKISQRLREMRKAGRSGGESRRRKSSRRRGRPRPTRRKSLRRQSRS